MQVRYQAALRPEGADYIRGVLPTLVQRGAVARLFRLARCLLPKRIDDLLQFPAEEHEVDLAAAVAIAVGLCLRALRRLSTRGLAALRVHIVKPVACAADGEAFLVQELADAA